MDSPELTRYVPGELMDTYTPIALLREGRETQTVLLRERESGKKVVLKRSTGTDDFSEEKYRLLTELSAENVARVYGFFRSGGAVYLLQEYIPGESLLDYMQKKGPLSAEETAEIGIAVCRALQKLHGLDPPLIHRDIKAENIIRTPEGTYVLIDFGISRLFRSGKDRDSKVMGTPFSSPPEQFGYQQTDPRSDIYGLGVLLHELATGEYLLGKGQLPGCLRPVVKRCTRFDPGDRYPNAAALERALRRAVAGRKTAPRKRLLAGAVLAAAALCAALWAAGTQKRAPLPTDIYRFASPAIEAEVCRQLDLAPGSVTYGDLENVSAILLCGDSAFESWDQIQVYGAEIYLDGGLMEGRGTVDSLEDIPNLPNLEELALCSQQVTDLRPLTGSGVRRLALHGNGIKDVSPLAECNQLTELYISGNPVSDLRALSACQFLWRLNAGATMLTDLSALSQFPALTFLEVHDCAGYLALEGLERQENLRYLSIRPVDAAQIGILNRLTGLQDLYLWGPEGMTDLHSLSGLTGLRRLYIDMPGLSSLDGAEAFTELDFLDIRGAAALDITPLLGLGQLRELNVSSLRADDWAALGELPRLALVWCSAGQADDISRALAARPEIQVNIR